MTSFNKNCVCSSEGSLELPYDEKVYDYFHIMTSHTQLIKTRLKNLFLRGKLKSLIFQRKSVSSSQDGKKSVYRLIFDSRCIYECI